MSGGGPQNLFALMPVAWAQLVGLQRVEDAQRLLRIAALVEAVDRHMLDHVMRIDDEGSAQANAGVLVENAERTGELMLVVRDPREIERGEALVRLAPGEVHEIAVGRAADELGVAVGEVLQQLAIADDLRSEEH